MKRGGLEDYEGSPISDRVLHDVLTTLKRYSIIDENLEFTDPIVREAARGGCNAFDVQCGLLACLAFAYVYSVAFQYLP
ncbi:hypothetical protein [Vulcanisaeta distributa]|uniref:hypothetical protein n=1 Tax=Vulcanisaeta distributa TaxID=164451 RepID=UPI0006D18BC0|nr:hypothetical protein [Vulcanisaeta distributa]